MASIWLVPEEDGSDTVGNMRTSSLNPERVKALVSEFIKQFTVEDWVNMIYVLPKVYYGSSVDATPLNKPCPYHPEYWGYEVKGRFDSNDGNPCLVIELERFYRSRYYGIATREIWIDIDYLVQILRKIFGEAVSDDVVYTWKIAASKTYSTASAHKNSFTCTLRNLTNASTAFKMGLNERADLVNE